MVTDRKYVVRTAAEFDLLDSATLYEEVRWNNDSSQFIAKIRNAATPPEDHITMEQAADLVSQPNWTPQL